MVGFRTNHSVKQELEKPDCCDDDSFRLWAELASFKTAKKEPIEFCNDCTPEYQAKAKAAGKCSYPDRQFVWRKAIQMAGWYELMAVDKVRPSDVLAVLGSPDNMKCFRKFDKGA